MAESNLQETGPRCRCVQRPVFQHRLEQVSRVTILDPCLDRNSTEHNVAKLSRPTPISTPVSEKDIEPTSVFRGCSHQQKKTEERLLSVSKD
jgi:hypothetical protein